MIFVDTGFFFAMVSANDPDHQGAVEVLESLEAQSLPELLVTTNHVVFETITLARRRKDHALAVEVGDALWCEKLARIHRASEEEERLAFDYLKQHPHLRLSAVDALSFVVMDRLGITEAFAVDHRDFGQRFRVRPGRRR